MDVIAIYTAKLSQQAPFVAVIHELPLFLCASLFLKICFM